MRTWLMGFLIIMTIVTAGCSVAPNATSKPPSLLTISHPTSAPTPTQTKVLPTPTAFIAATPTPLTGCPRTIFPRESRPLVLYYAPFAPGLEWRTSLDTIYPVQNTDKIYIRAAISRPVSGTVTATLLGSSPPEQLQTILQPTALVPPPSNAAPEGYFINPPGMVLLLAGLRLPREGCWDLDIRVQNLDGHVVVQAKILDTTSPPTPALNLPISTLVPTPSQAAPTTSPTTPTETNATPESNCPRTMLPLEWQPPYPYFAAFAPSLEWRTAVLTDWPALQLDPLIVRAANLNPESGTVIATRLGSSQREQVQSDLTPMNLRRSENTLPNPPGTVLFSGGLEFPHAGCWDLDIHIGELEGHVIMQVGAPSP